MFAELVASLALWISLNTHYTALDRLPDVHSLPRLELQKRYCDGDCPIRAYYIWGGAIHIADDLDPENNVCDRSILLHELIHYFQYTNGRFSEFGSYTRQEFIDGEAFDLQNYYLVSEAVYEGLSGEAMMTRCHLELDQSLSLSATGGRGTPGRKQPSNRQP